MPETYTYFHKNSEIQTLYLFLLLFFLKQNLEGKNNNIVNENKEKYQLEDYWLIQY